MSNVWQCEFDGGAGSRCDATAVGVGDAIGLMAIGWDVRVIEGMGYPRLLCPAHRMGGSNAADKVALWWQKLMRAVITP